MKLTVLSSLTGAVLAGLVLAVGGCSSSAPSAKPAGKPTSSSATGKAKPFSAKPASDKLSEGRIEALSRFANGVSLDMRGKPKEAIEEFRLAALADPGNEVLVSEVARRFLRARQTDKAVEILTVAAKQPKAAAMIQVLLGAAYGQQGKTDLAITSLRKALTRDPKLLAAYQNLFTVYLQAGKFPEARAVLEEGDRKGGNEPDFLLGLTDLFARYAQAQPKDISKVKPRALALLERASKVANQEDEMQLLRLADGYRAFGDTKRATELYTQLLKIAPELPGLREKLIESFIRDEQPEKAKEQIKALIRDNPTNPQLHYLLGTLLTEDKDAATRDASLKEAIDKFRTVIMLKADFEPAYFELAQTYLRLKDTTSALKALGTARGLFGGTFLVEFYTGLVHSENKNYPAAVKALTGAELIAKTSETNRLTVGLYFQLGAVHERNKDFATAEKYFRTCIEMQPDFPEALNYLGYMWAERGTNLDEARTMIEKAVQAEPENGAFLDSLAWVLYQQGKVKEAIPWAEKSLKFTKEPDPTLYDHLGDIYLKAGKRDQAREAWRKALAIEKTPEVQKKLDALGPRGK